MKRITLYAVAFTVLLECVHGFPAIPSERKGRQDDDDAPPAVNPNGAGFNVAQIILGALTGNIDTIVKGSFGFIEDPTVNKLSHNYWEHLKGNPTKTPPWLTTTRPTRPPQDNESESDPDAESLQSQPQYVTTRTPAANQVLVIQYQPEPVAQAQTPQVAPTHPLAIDANAGSSPSELYNQVSTQFNPTSPPVRTTQPTYATLAPLHIIEGISISTSPPSSVTDGDDEDVDESESEIKGRIVKGPDATVSNKLH